MPFITRRTLDDLNARNAGLSTRLAAATARITEQDDEIARRHRRMDDLYATYQAVIRRSVRLRRRLDRALVACARYRAELAELGRAVDGTLLDAHRELTAHAEQLTADLDHARDIAAALEQENAHLTKQLATGTTADLHARLAALTAADEAMDVPVGLEVAAEDWRAAVIAAIAQLTPKRELPEVAW